MKWLTINYIKMLFSERFGIDFASFDLPLQGIPFLSQGPTNNNKQKRKYRTQHQSMKNSGGKITKLVNNE